MRLTDSQLVEALAENDHEDLAEALAAKIAAADPANQPPDMDAWMKGRLRPKAPPPGKAAP